MMHGIQNIKFEGGYSITASNKNQRQQDVEETNKQTNAYGCRNKFIVWLFAKSISAFA
jgi:hypothetical protein